MPPLAVTSDGQRSEGIAMSIPNSDQGQTLLEKIINTGNRGAHGGVAGNKVTCADGFTVSVIAGGGVYCQPRPAMCVPAGKWLPCPQPPSSMENAPCDFPGPYYEVEVGFPSQRPEPWDAWKEYSDGDDPTETVYGFVPVSLVRSLVASHGGEA